MRVWLPSETLENYKGWEINNGSIWKIIKFLVENSIFFRFRNSFLKFSQLFLKDF